MTKGILKFALLFALLQVQCLKNDFMLPPMEVQNGVFIWIEKTGFSSVETIVVKVINNGPETIYLEGCNPIYISSRTDNSWVDKPLRLCVWEGYAIAVLPSGHYAESHPGVAFPGTHKFFANIYYGCQSPNPISQAECGRHERVESPQFTVAK